MAARTGTDQGGWWSLSKVKKVSAWGVVCLGSQSLSRVRELLQGVGGGGRDGGWVTYRGFIK